VVAIFNVPPDAVMVTVAVAVLVPVLLVALSVYVVVVVGLTVVDPDAAVELNVPGVMATLTVFVVAQLSVLLAPLAMLAGLALKLLILGKVAACCTVTVAVAVAELAAPVAVRVYVVVAVGLTVVDPDAAAEVNVPGAMETLVALVALQLSVLLEPLLMLVGFAVNELTAAGGAGVG
jgi:hypothetical protein